MKMSSKRAVSLASVAAILASFAAMPASAVESNVYSVSYETLTAAVTTADGDVVPAGSVAVTVSIDENAGFDGNTLTLEVADGYWAQTRTDGMLVIDKGNVLDDALISGAVSEDGNTICVATASADRCNENGALFTVYMTTMVRNYSTDFVSVVSAVESTVDITAIQENANQNEGIGTCSWIPPGQTSEWYTIWNYAAGDADDNSTSEDDINVDATDASYILQACEAAPNHELLVSAIDDASETWKQYFPSARFAECADANINGVISVQDASDILNYAAIVGAENTYTGNVATICQEIVIN